METFDRLVEVEAALIAAGHDVDGHDAGNGEFNIFIFTDNPEASFSDIPPLLRDVRSWKAAFRDIDSDDFIPLWPSGSSDFAIK